MNEMVNDGQNHDYVDGESQIEVMRELVKEAETWSELLLKYSRSLIIYFLPATFLALAVTIIYFLYILLSWGYWSQSQQIINTVAFLLLLIIALLAIWKEADALLRHRLNKKRHAEWRKKFQALRELEKNLEDFLEPSSPDQLEPGSGQGSI